MRGIYMRYMWPRLFRTEEACAIVQCVKSRAIYSIHHLLPHDDSIFEVSGYIGKPEFGRRSQRCYQSKGR